MTQDSAEGRLGLRMMDRSIIWVGAQDRAGIHVGALESTTEYCKEVASLDLRRQFGRGGTVLHPWGLSCEYCREIVGWEAVF